MKRTVTLVRSPASMLGTVVLAMTALSFLPARIHADPTWEVIAAPSPSGSECDLRAIDVVSAHEAWAVGIYQPSSGENRSLVLHYVNGTWAVVPSPNPGLACIDGNLLWGGNALTDVDVLSATDVWAVGAGCYGAETLIEHWDGFAWNLVPSANPFPGGQNILTGVAAISPTNAWAVGYTSEAIGTGTLIEHWNGTAWSVVPSPRPGTGGYLSSVVAISASDVWAVGGYYDDTESLWENLIVHWNGSRWDIVPSPSPGTYTNALTGLVALASNDVWVIGQHSSGAGVLTLTEHWDGSSWQVVPSPNVDARYSASNLLRSVTAVSTNSVWAVGMFQNENTDIHQRRTLLMHWDGSSWKLATTPSPGKSAELNAIVAGPYEEAWCVGRFSEYPVDIYDGHYTLLQSLMMEGSLRDVLAVSPAAGAGAATLGLPSPNPATGRVSLSLRLPARADVSLAIFDVRGRMMRTILTGSADAGDHAATWDGMDSRGQPCGPGLYFARLAVGGRVLASRPVTLLR